MAAPKLGEFERIARFFAPLAAPEALGLVDDVAIIPGPPGQQYVLKTDAIVEGVHFLPDDPADQVAQKLLRVNLSDLAGKGATPVGYLLTTALPRERDEAWLERFAEGLARDQKEFGIGLLGGDSVATTGPATLSVAAVGRVRTGETVLRSGAKPGDTVFVSGTLGDGALGLKALRGELSELSPAHRDFLTDRYRLPRPRLNLGRALVGIAHAMMDISDGLVADLRHICETSGVGAVVEAERLPLSPAARAAISADGSLVMAVLAGGDDYELLFTAPA
ncbi:MAG: thiamine-phosphate kinase, partial [Stellaceae bacterium]